MNLTLKQFEEYARRFRRTEEAVVRAENVLMQQSLRKKKLPTIKTTERILAVFNGEPLPYSKVKALVAERFPALNEKAVDMALCRLSKNGHLERSGRPYHYVFRKVHEV